MASVGYSIRQAIKAVLVAADAAALLPGIPSANIKNRMMVKVSELDQLPAVVIAPYGTMTDKPTDFEGSRDRQYRIRVAVVDAMQGDTETNDELYSGWMEAALTAIVRDFNGAITTLGGVPTVWEINTEFVQKFDDSLLAKGLYAVQNGVLRFESQE